MKPISDNPSKADMQAVGAFIEALPAAEHAAAGPSADCRLPGPASLACSRIFHHRQRDLFLRVEYVEPPRERRANRFVRGLAERKPQRG